MTGGARQPRAAAATMSFATLLRLRGPRLLRAVLRPQRWSRRRGGSCEPPAGAAVRIGCASGFWGDTAAAGRRREALAGTGSRAGRGRGPAGSGADGVPPCSSAAAVRREAGFPRFRLPLRDHHVAAGGCQSPLSRE